MIRYRLAINLLVWITGLAWLTHSVQTGFSGGPADILRRWCVSQYIIAGTDPYQVALNVLHQEVGPIDEVKLAKKRIFHIPIPASGAAQLGVIDAVGPPEAVYPPSAHLLLAMTVGQLPKSAVQPLWLIINLMGLLLFIWIAAEMAIRWGLCSREWFPTLLGLGLLWAPAQETLSWGQFSIVVSLALLLGVWQMDRRGWLSVLGFSIALIKPSMAIPFLMIPLIRGHWGVLLGTMLVQVVATGLVGFWTDTAPGTLIREWVGVSQYFTQGPYSLQTVLNKLELDNSIVGLALTFTFLAAVLLWLLRHRRCKLELIFDYLCLVAMLWTYHAQYDFVLLLIPLTRLSHTIQPTRRPRQLFSWSIAVTMLSFVVLSLGTWPPAYVGDGQMCATIRWLCRLLLIGLFAAMMFMVRRSATIDDPSALAGTPCPQTL